MTDQISLNQLAKASRRGKATLQHMLETGELTGIRDTHGRKTTWIDRNSAVAAGLLHDSDPHPRPGHNGTIDTALRAAISDEIQPLLSHVTDRTPNVDHTALTAAINQIDTTLQRIEAVLREHLPARRKRRWWH